MMLNLKTLLNYMSILSVLLILNTCCQILSSLSIFVKKLLYISMSPCSSQINSEPIHAHKFMQFVPYWYYHGLWNTNVLYFYIRSGKQLT